MPTGTTCPTATTYLTTTTCRTPTRRPTGTFERHMSVIFASLRHMWSACAEGVRRGAGRGGRGGPGSRDDGQGEGGAAGPSAVALRPAFQASRGPVSAGHRAGRGCARDRHGRPPVPGRTVLPVLCAAGVRVRRRVRGGGDGAAQAAAVQHELEHGSPAGHRVGRTAGRVGA